MKFGWQITAHRPAPYVVLPEFKKIKKGKIHFLCFPIIFFPRPVTPKFIFPTQYFDRHAGHRTHVFFSSLSVFIPAIPVIHFNTGDCWPLPTPLHPIPRFFLSHRCIGKQLATSINPVVVAVDPFFLQQISLLSTTTAAIAPDPDNGPAAPRESIRQAPLHLILLIAHLPRPEFRAKHIIPRSPAAKADTRRQVSHTAALPYRLPTTRPPNLLSLPPTRRQ